MTAVLIVAFVLIAIEMKVSNENGFFPDYMSIKQTNAIKGIFVLLVFMGHFVLYCKPDDPLSAHYWGLKAYLGQMVVTVFLFYSGYGIMESVRKKGREYVRGIPKNRALKTLIHFDIAVLLFLLERMILGKPTELSQFLLSLVCWSTLGNSNWFIFAIIFTYLFAFVAFSIFRKNEYLALATITLLCVAFVVVLTPYRPDYCYNTVMCFPMGIGFSMVREKLESIVMKNDFCYFASLLAVFFVYYAAFARREQNVWYYQLWACLFTLLVVMVTMKVRIDNGFVQFLGTHTFSIYILQRLPMWYMANKLHVKEHYIVFFIASFLATCTMAVAFDWAMGKLDAKLFKKPAPVK